MKINLDFYKEGQENLLPEEQDIIEYIKNNKKENYNEVIHKDKRNNVILALSNIRENILNWYPIKKDATILEIGANLGELTGILCEKANKVIAIESSLNKAKAIKKRYNKEDNLEVIVGTIEDINIQDKFDYITLFGTFENLSKIYKGSEYELLNLLKDYLKEDGKILLAIDNRTGLQNFSRTDENEVNIGNLKDKKTYSLNKIEKIIKKANLEINKIYYPMPDYRLTNVIYTDEKPLSRNNVSRNIIYNSENTIKFYQENEAYINVLEENSSNFKIFANSFFIEITKNKIEEEKIQFISFSNIRKPEYRIKTIIKEGNVYKYALNEKSRDHIEKIKENIDILKRSGLKTVDSYEENRIISKYTNANTLDKVITRLLKENKTDEAIEIIRKYKNEIYEKLEKTNNENNVFDKYNIDYKKEEIEKMTFVKYGLWDLIFQNCFYIENELYFYDQEWREEVLPIDFITYRAIKYFNRIRKYFSEDELYKILEIEQENIELFEKLDNKIQEKIRDEDMWEIHTRGMEIIDLKRRELTSNHEINLLTIENEQNKALLEQKEKEIEELKKTLNYVFNSKSWKITKPFRAVLKLKKNGKE